MGIALLFTALCTRPPQIHGFHLGDYWAWLRYVPAISNQRRLRLCDAWTDVDRHQKTVLSDELGVGFTTQFVTEIFGCIDIVDTLHFVNVLEPGSLTLGVSSKTGPQKSPDYICRMRGTGYLVLECKGTQSSRQALRAAIAKGKVQKQNVSAGTARIRHSLVAGLYIPQWKSSDRACIYVADPWWDELETLLAGQSEERIDDAITQVSLAKHLALCGLTQAPAHLARHRTGEVPPLPQAARDEIDRRSDLRADKPQVLFETSDLRFRVQGVDPAPWAKFLAKAPAGLLEALSANDGVSDIVAALRMASKNAEWYRSEEERAAEITTPLGFTFRLEFDNRENTVSG